MGLGDGVTELCPHEDDPLLCPPCQGRSPLVRQTVEGTGWNGRRVAGDGTGWTETFTARFNSKCDCGDGIVPGDQVRSRTDRFGKAHTVHEECAGDI